MDKIIYLSYFTNNNVEYVIGSTSKGLSVLMKKEEISNIKGYNFIDDTNENNLYIESIVKYFNNETEQFDLKLDLIGTDFQKKVWNELIKIPYGGTKSYSEIASNIGDEKSVRAVANAIGKNNLLIVVPCHRVIGKNKKLTGFSSGLDLKKYLLDLENNTDYIL